MRKKSSLSFELISEILIKYDPVGIYTGGNRDEYDSEAIAILGQINKELSVNEIQSIIYNEFIESFDKSIAGKLSKYRAIAEEVYSLLHDR